MFARIVPSVAACCLGLTCLPNAAAAQANVPTEPILCAPDKEGPPKYGPSCESRLGGIVTHGDKVVRVTLRDGSTKAFRDAPLSCQDPASKLQCLYFKVKGYYPQNDAVVVQRWLDGGPTAWRLGSYMVERTRGRVIELPSDAVYSPDGARFVAMSACTDHCANRIDIWSIQDGTAKLEWRHQVKQSNKAGEKTYAYWFIDWVGNDAVKLRIAPEGEAPGDSGKDILDDQGVDALLRRGAQGWELQRP
jgi:hypothetical protein